MSARVAVPALTRYADLDLDLVNDRIAEMNRLVALGDTTMVLAHARRWYDRLAMSGLKASDPRSAEARVGVGLVLGAAQEAALPWFQRAPAVLRTYRRVEMDAILPLPLHAQGLNYARLIERMAPLYREMGRHATSILRFTDGLYYARFDPDPQLRLALYRNRAHVWAVQGDERHWREDLDAARAIAELAPTTMREMLIGLVQYSEGEGYKRLAYHPHADDMLQKASYAERALRSLSEAKVRTSDQRASHLLLLDVAVAQSLIWLDPAAALQRCEALDQAIQHFVPGMLPKLERTIAHAKQRLATRQGGSAPVFSLEHGTHERR